MHWILDLDLAGLCFSAATTTTATATTAGLCFSAATTAAAAAAAAAAANARPVQHVVIAVITSPSGRGDNAWKFGSRNLRTWFVVLTSLVLIFVNVPVCAMFLLVQAEYI